ncbi:hypothetical protein [Saccharothrix deserti]|uniref:hypothetical protein n=1 Tax=Saccharothrix deserti TaxID=2593674 RepID=UPI00131A9668|nr:hypothetical protein [Saccharothrix deserti]
MAARVGEGAVEPRKLVRGRLYLVLTSTSLRSKSLEPWRWRWFSVVPAVVFDLSLLEGCELVDHDPDGLRSELPERTAVLHFAGAPEPVVLWVRKGQHAVDITRRINDHVKHRGHAR